MTETTVPAPWTTAQLVEIRAQLNLSRKDLADLTGLTQAVIWRIEHVPAGQEKDADADLRTKMQAALTAYVVEHPGGKPKPAPKTPKAPKATKPDVDIAAVAAAFLAVAEVVEAQKAEAKTKKSSTKPFEAIMIVLADQSARFNQ